MYVRQKLTFVSFLCFFCTFPLEPLVKVPRLGLPWSSPKSWSKWTGPPIKLSKERDQKNGEKFCLLPILPQTPPPTLVIFKQILGTTFFFYFFFTLTIICRSQGEASREKKKKHKKFNFQSYLHGFRSDIGTPDQM